MKIEDKLPVIPSISGKNDYTITVIFSDWLLKRFDNQSDLNTFRARLSKGMLYGNRDCWIDAIEIAVEQMGANNE